MTPLEIAEKYVYGNNDSLTDRQEVLDMVKDIEEYAKELKSDLLHNVSNRVISECDKSKMANK